MTAVTASSWELLYKKAQWIGTTDTDRGQRKGPEDSSPERIRMTIHFREQRPEVRSRWSGYSTFDAPAIPPAGQPLSAMAYIITEPCIGTKDKSCVDVCPVDCIHGDDGDTQLFIDPEVCIDCGACVSACPVEAIYADSDVPDKWKNFIEINAEWYKK